MANSADPDQLASQKPTDLDLHCLQRQGISRFSRTRVNSSQKHNVLIRISSHFYVGDISRIYCKYLTDLVVTHEEKKCLQT